MSCNSYSVRMLIGTPHILVHACGVQAHAWLLHAACRRLKREGETLLFNSTALFLNHSFSFISLICELVQARPPASHICMSNVKESESFKNIDEVFIYIKKKVGSSHHAACTMHFCMRGPGTCLPSPCRILIKTWNTAIQEHSYLASPFSAFIIPLI